MSNMWQRILKKVAVQQACEGDPPEHGPVSVPLL